MAPQPLTVLVVGATGSIGRLVVSEAIARGHTVRALVRDRAKAARLLPADTALATGDVTRPETLPEAVAGVDALVLTLGSSSPETVDYAGVRNVLTALAFSEDPRPHVVLMTSIGVTTRGSGYGHLLEWKRRSERLVRAGGLTYTIVRPGWFDMNGPEEHRPVFLQGDRRRSGGPADGTVARADVARVLVAALAAPEAAGRTFELVAEHGAPPADLGSLFAVLDQDPPGSLDAVHDEANMPLDDEPRRVRDDLDDLGRFPYPL